MAIIPPIACGDHALLRGWRNLRAHENYSNDNYDDFCKSIWCASLIYLCNCNHCGAGIVLEMGGKFQLSNEIGALSQPLRAAYMVWNLNSIRAFNARSSRSLNIRSQSYGNTAIKVTYGFYILKWDWRTLPTVQSCASDPKPNFHQRIQCANLISTQNIQLTSWRTRFKP